MNTARDKQLLKALINSFPRTDKPLVIAIDGMCGSGKSTLGKWLHKEFPDSNLFSMDDYFLQPHQKTPERLNEIGGNVDYARFKEEILDHINERQGLDFQRFNCCTQSLQAKKHADWKPFVFIEGSYSQHPYFGSSYDLRVFCEVTKEEQKERIYKRNGAEKLQRFLNEWIPKENAYFSKYKIKEMADC